MDELARRPQSVVVSAPWIPLALCQSWSYKTSGWAEDRTFGIWFTLRFKTNGITLLVWNEVVRGGNGTAWFDSATVLHVKVNLHRDHVPSVPSPFMRYESHESTNPGISRDIQGQLNPLRSVELRTFSCVDYGMRWKLSGAASPWTAELKGKPRGNHGFPLDFHWISHEIRDFHTFMWISLKSIHWWIDLWAALFYFQIFWYFLWPWDPTVRLILHDIAGSTPRRKASFQTSRLLALMYGVWKCMERGGCCHHSPHVISWCLCNRTHIYIYIYDIWSFHPHQIQIFAFQGPYHHHSTARKQAVYGWKRRAAVAQMLAYKLQLPLFLESIA